MNKNKNIVLSVIFIIFSTILSFLGFSNLKATESSYFNLSRANSLLLEKKTKAEEKFKTLSQENNNRKSKLKVINNEIDKFDIIKDKTLEIDNMNKGIIDSLISFRKNNFNEFYNIDNGKLYDYKPLKGNFIKDNITEEDIKSNLIMIQFILNSYYNYDLNKNIAKHNLKAYENLGIIDYLKNGDNYMLKSILLNETSKFSQLNEEKENILKEEEDFFSIYENVFGENENIKILSSEKNAGINAIDKEKYEQENNFKTLNAFCIDILNSSVNYLENFKIVTEKGISTLKVFDKTIMSEKTEDKKLITTYYNRVNGETYTLTEERE
ncbi:hypothetical protein [Peptoniphilus porci]|uniref:Uncharacterized protein n=1 Tax=Peptoniphilus porci TaxID=2652280 RepID=A0A1U7LYL5_9FIRM|nr:hypothetical protein [Peptoniphilus porci]OLR64510.1 hypothetical protein BIV18_02585 [Peptoniphilus porci]